MDNDQNNPADDQGVPGWNRGDQQESQQGLDRQQNQQNRQQDGEEQDAGREPGAELDNEAGQADDEQA